VVEDFVSSKVINLRNFLSLLLRIASLIVLINGHFIYNFWLYMIIVAGNLKYIKHCFQYIETLYSINLNP
jgi:hypothetical protein